MLYVGLDLSRKRLDWLALDRDGQPAGIGATAPDRDGLAKLGRRLGDAPALAVIESMSGARFVHDQLELAGWDMRIADAVKARGLAPLACNTDRIDCWVLAELARRMLVPEIWLPDSQVRAHRERARFRLARLRLPEPWRSTLRASLALIDRLDEQIDQLAVAARVAERSPLLFVARGLKEQRLHVAQHLVDRDGRVRKRDLLLLGGVAPRDGDCCRQEVAATDLDAERHAIQLPLVNLRPGRYSGRSSTRTRTSAARSPSATAAAGLEHISPVILAEDRNDHDLLRRDARREPQPT
jgi:hypothetical protein